MSSLRQRFQELEQPYMDCYVGYQDILSTITDQPDIFNTITLTMLKNQINDRSVNTITEAIQKRMLDIKPSGTQCPPESRADSPVCSVDSTGATTSDSTLSDSLSTSEDSFDFSSDEATSSYSANDRSSRNIPPPNVRTLRVLIAGDINTGKTSVLNLFLGDVYLPAYSGKCTTVPCEVHNSNQRLARVYYHDSNQPEDIEMPANSLHSKWKAVGELVHTGEFKGKAVRRLLLFWPLRFFDDSLPHEFGPESGFGSLVDNRTDPDETTPKTIADDDPHQTHVKQVVSAGNAEPLPIVFLDLPGLSDNDFGVSKLLENVPDFHLFIFVIDIGGVPVRKTFENMLENVKRQITKHGIDFNPESALFLLNRSDLYHPPPGQESIENDVLSAIRPKWPMVDEEQLYRLSCTKIMSREESMEPFREKIWNFLEAGNRQNLEEHYLWLIKLLEAIDEACFEAGVTWLADDTSLQKIKDYAKRDTDFLEKELGTIEDKDSSFRKHIMQEAKKSEGKLREHIQKQLGGRTNGLDKKLRSIMKEKQVQKIREDFDSELLTFLGQHRTRLKKNVKLVEYLREQRELTLDMNDVLNAIATLVSIPLASIVLFGRSLKEEIETATSDPKDKKISRRAQYFVQQGTNAIQQEISFIISQLKIRREILSFESKKKRNTEKQALVDVEVSLKKLWEIYIHKVLQHKYSFDDVRHVTRKINANVDIVSVTRDSGFEDLALKRLNSGLNNDESVLTGLAQSHNFFGELVIMRSLSRKNNRHCVVFRGSASWIEGDEQMLGILMEMADKTLEDVIIELQKSQIGPTKRLQLALGAAKGLEYLHRNGYTHKDVKPRHFLVYENHDKEIVKICDFGHVKEKSVKTTTDPRIVAYYAPELFGQAARHSTMSDVYSLGLVIWELWHCRKITCNPGEPPSFRELPIGEFKTVIKSCLDVQPNRRPESREVVQILHKLVGAK